MPFVIFYSWQSDRDPKTTRYFIREALDLAARILAREMEVQEVVRIDQDTEGIPGHPEIFRTICGKIDSCSIFVADLTYVAKTDSGDRIPNPNVTIELGYAMKSVGPDRYIAVMNTEYGGPEDLPFDLRHRRWPIQYGLTPEMPADDRKKRKEELAEKLAKAIRSIVESGVLNNSASAEHVVETSSTSCPAIFFDEEKPFAIYDEYRRDAVELRVLRGAKMYLRLVPTRLTGELSTADAYEIAKAANLEPMRDAHSSTGISLVRNEYGAAAIAMNREAAEVFALTQILRRTREIWGVDALTVRAEYCMAWSNTDIAYIAGGAIEKTFDWSLSHYLRVAKDHLGVTLPLRFIAGVDGVKGYRMALPSGHWERFDGRMVDNHVFLEGLIEDFGANAHDMLLPFYQRLWRECGLKRPERDEDRKQ